MPNTQNTTAADASANENGYRPPPGKSRQSTSSTIAASETATTGTSAGRLASATPPNTTTRSRNATGEAASVSTASAANRQRAPCCNVHSASSASAIPSANGNAADSTIPAHTTANVRLDQRAAGPHSRHSTSANASAATAIV